MLRLVHLAKTHGKPSHSSHRLIIKRTTGAGMARLEHFRSSVAEGMNEKSRTEVQLLRVSSLKYLAI
jgi:hypothetical protein